MSNSIDLGCLQKPIIIACGSERAKQKFKSHKNYNLYRIRHYTKHAVNGYTTVGEHFELKGLHPFPRGLGGGGGAGVAVGYS